mmetsp:Transcript_6258/g.13705  ORF Transcript_6258/g.13705 Transcript_6258/m.13705 type:complete len:310 (+) Transcript_6258:384-1313(+)
MPPPPRSQVGPPAQAPHTAPPPVPRDPPPCSARLAVSLRRLRRHLLRHGTVQTQPQAPLPCLGRTRSARVALGVDRALCVLPPVSLSLLAAPTPTLPPLQSPPLAQPRAPRSAFARKPPRRFCPSSLCPGLAVPAPGPRVSQLWRRLLAERRELRQLRSPLRRRAPWRRSALQRGARSPPQLPWSVCARLPCPAQRHWPVPPPLPLGSARRRAAVWRVVLAHPPAAGRLRYVGWPPPPPLRGAVSSCPTPLPPTDVSPRPRPRLSTAPPPPVAPRPRVVGPPPHSAEPPPYPPPTPRHRRRPRHGVSCP